MWSENWTAFTTFMNLDTQWRYGMAGPTGLDYSVLNDVFRFTGVPESEWPELFSSIRVMEDAALRVMHEKAK